MMRLHLHRVSRRCVDVCEHMAGAANLRDYKLQDLESDTVWQHVTPRNVTLIRGTAFDDVHELPDLIPLDQAFVAMVRAQLRPKPPAHQPPGPPELVDQPDR